MRITKDGRAYIRQVSYFAERIFTMYGWTWGGPPFEEEGYIPTADQIAARITEKVHDLSKTCFASESGRILVRKSDFEFGFHVYLDLKNDSSNNQNKIKGEP